MTVNPELWRKVEVTEQRRENDGAGVRCERHRLLTAQPVDTRKAARMSIAPPATPSGKRP